jgi:teichuronic acid biosynthesis glycosyltransferase TuaC
MARGAYAPIRSCDLVHLHGNGFIIEMGRFLAERCRKPYVITLYGTDVWHHDPARHARFAQVVEGARHRIFYSQGLLEFARPLGLAPAPSGVIYAPVPATFHPLDALARTALRRELAVGDARLLLTVKRLHEVAGHDVLLRAFQRVAGEHPDTALWIVGQGELRSKLEAQARDLGLASQVRFLGMLDNDTLWRLYAAADLFVLPSRLESWGTVMLESLACGTRVVATDTVGGAEVHSHFPEDVMLAPRESAEGLATAIGRALAAHERVSAAAEQRLRQEFSVEGCATRYLDIYRSALHARDPRHAR